jgi:CRP/FNR family transcriptional regulator, polysaccharide utilization system transcription regulator
MATLKIEADCQQCPFFSSSVFAELDAGLIEELNQQKSTNIYRKGQVVFFEDRLPVGIYCMRSGKVKISRVTSDGKEQIVRVAHSGSLLGVKSIVNGSRHSTSAITLENSEICFIPRALVLRLIVDCGSVSSRIMLHLVELLEEAERKISSLAHKSVKQRLAEILLLLETLFQPDEDGRIWICMSREDIGSLIGTATASVIRLMAEMKEKGLIESQGRLICITDREALRREMET